MGPGFKIGDEVLIRAEPFLNGSPGDAYLVKRHWVFAIDLNVVEACDNIAIVSSWGGNYRWFRGCMVEY